MQKDLSEQVLIRREKLANLQAEGKDPFVITKFDVTHHSTDIKENFALLDGKEVVIAGRMMSKRVMGKASFCNVQDLPGNIRSGVVSREGEGRPGFSGTPRYSFHSSCVRLQQ